jgi:hypothetical protein
MLALFSSLRKLLGHWSRQQEAALRQMSERKTASERLAGYSKSERVDAKFMLLAMAPFLTVMLSDVLGWSRNAMWHVCLWLSIAWAVGVSFILLAAYWRAIRHSFRRKK